MKRTILILTMMVLFGVSGFAQDEPKVCISQEAANKCGTAARELIEARKVISEFLSERGATTAQIAALNEVNRGLRELVALGKDVEAAKDRLIAVQLRIIEIYEKLVTDLENRLNKPKSGFQKFLDVMKRVVDVVIGIGIGRVLGGI